MGDSRRVGVAVRRSATNVQICTWALDVLDLVIAAVDEIDADATMHIFVNAIRNRYAARIGKRLDTGSHIDPIAV